MYFSNHKYSLGIRTRTIDEYCVIFDNKYGNTRLVRIAIQVNKTRRQGKERLKRYERIRNK